MQLGYLGPSLMKQVRWRLWLGIAERGLRRKAHWELKTVMRSLPHHHRGDMGRPPRPINPYIGLLYGLS